jgi:hypothetical protein
LLLLLLLLLWGFLFEEMATSAEMQALLASVGQQQLPLAVAAGRTYGRTSLPTQHSPQSRARILLQEMASLTDRLVKVAGVAAAVAAVVVVVVVISKACPLFCYYGFPRFLVFHLC